MRRNAPVFILILMLIAIAARLIPGARTIDDAFITFRYSTNLLDGLGFVYNEGVRTLGTTTPFFAGLMTLIGGVLGGRDFPQYALFVSALADSLSAALLYLIVRRVTNSSLYAALPAALWAISPMSVTFAVGGMETSVTILWMMASFAVFILADETRAKALTLGICAALGLLTRVDSALWIAPLFGWQLMERVFTRRDRPLLRRLPWLTWLSAAAVLLPWVVFSTAYFGSPIPNSVTAKRDAYLIEPFSALARLIQAYSTPFFEFDAFGSTGAMIGALAYLTLSLFAILYAARHARRLIPLLLYPWLYFAAFSLLNPLIFRWYLAPPMPALMLGITLGAWTLVRPLLANEHRVPRMTGAGVLSALGLLWLGLSLNGWVLMPDHGPQRPAPRMAWHAIELLYQQMGTTLREDFGVTRATRVASGDIGAVGFFSGAAIVDTVGLVTPELTRYYPVDPALIAEGQNYAIPPALIADTQPDFLVTMEAFIRLGLAQDEAFLRDYALVLEYPTTFYGTGMQLWQRRE